MLKGSITALVTPFRADKVDEAAFSALCNWQIEQGIDALSPCGTTGESPTLTHSEHRRVIELCVEATKGRVPVVAGTGSNSTKEAIELALHAKQAKANAVLVVAPYYNKPTQEGLYRHYATLAEAVDIPIILYNIPGRSVIDISVETMARLAKIANIIGVKDATGDLTRPLRVRAKVGSDFTQLSGEDATTLAFLASGGVGCISVTSNVAPKLCASLQRAWEKKDIETCLGLQDQLIALNEVLFCETSPAPVKYALSLMGHCAEDLRLPLVPLSTPSKDKVKAALQSLRLI